MTVEHAAKVAGTEEDLVGGRGIAEARRGEEGLRVGGWGGEQVASDYRRPAGCLIHNWGVN